ncbi:rhomboid family intramembrane serine protease [Limnobacter humi]|uniref:Rhomboid family intramembrane serine protease n=1 Tax=Limnobacter humi TaxID=1778671 RepID=A0ABT1WIU0_9BURK|nr:rhomboid family intramembrane serine protease [Limnobacter humi]MCQ8896813.1 rhomboid family intramembrane serine protease [Limnobacter humi]
MKTILNYKPPKPLLTVWALWFAVALCALVAQLAWGPVQGQGLDLSESFFLNTLLGQFVHLGWVHLALNLLGLAVVLWGFERTVSPVTLWFGLGWGLLTVPLYLTWVERLDWYVGLSGALHTAFVVGLLHAWRHWFAARAAQSTPPSPLPLLLLTAGLLAKLVLEAKQASTGLPIDAWVGGHVAIQAHRGGALAGLLAYVARVPVLAWIGRRR